MAAPVICIGTILVDELFFCPEAAIAATSNPATAKRYAGGVAGNIARNLAMLQVPVQLVAALGTDADAAWLMQVLHKEGVDLELLQQVEGQTGKYASVINPDGSLYVAVCADECSKHMSPAYLQIISGELAKAAMIIIDTNVDTDTLNWVVRFTRNHGIPLLIEPVSVAKARKLAGMDLSGVFMITPNEDELPAVCNNRHDDIGGCLHELLQRGVQQVWLRQGGNGSLLHRKDGSKQVAVPPMDVADSTGAGDAALAGWVAAYHYGSGPLECQQAGHVMAMETLQVRGSVMTGFTMDKLLKSIKKYYPNE